MRTSIDPKTAKTLVKAKIKTERDRLNKLSSSQRFSDTNYVAEKRIGHSVLDTAAKPIFIELPSDAAYLTAKEKKMMEQALKDTLGQSLMCSGWSKRTFAYVVFAPCNTHGSRGCLVYYTFNTRSHRSDSTILTHLSIHALERLMERRRDVDILKVLSEEFSWDFINNMISAFEKEKPKPSATFQTKIQTGSGGWACLVKNGLEDSVITTWYK